MGGRMSEQPSAPETIVLDRVCLRRPRVADAEAIHEYGSDPDVARYADWPIRTEIGAVIGSLRERSEHWSEGPELSWVVTIASADRAIGGVSCRIEGHSAEVGFLMNRNHWGNGYATEATRAIIEWLFSLPSVSKVWATCDTENKASCRVLEKLGFKRECTLERAIVRPQISSKPRDAFMYARGRSIGTTR